ncbi:hypothetical protein QTO01_12335 [Vibrio mytili]|uniref:hypothetical protein n=1 Tax=Vibrio mytili TaxID=50718 RepID=UPI002F3FE1F3
MMQIQEILEIDELGSSILSYQFNGNELCRLIWINMAQSVGAFALQTEGCLSSRRFFDLSKARHAAYECSWQVLVKLGI